MCGLLYVNYNALLLFKEISQNHITRLYHAEVQTHVCLTKNKIMQPFKSRIRKTTESKFFFQQKKSDNSKITIRVLYWEKNLCTYRKEGKYK